MTAKNMEKGFTVGRMQVLMEYFKMIQLKDKEH